MLADPCVPGECKVLPLLPSYRFGAVRLVSRLSCFGAITCPIFFSSAYCNAMALRGYRTADCFLQT